MELDIALSKLKRLINPKKDSHDLLTRDLLFVMSPCLSAFVLRNNTWSKSLSGFYFSMLNTTQC